MTRVFDPIAEDPAPADPPAQNAVLDIPSGGETLYGVLHVPAGSGPHPAVVLLHGYPGYERNLDLAHVLRRAGYATFVGHYRGSWGVGGTFRLPHVLEDARAFVAALRSPERVAAYRLDPDRVAVVGHSMGGFAALHSAAADPEIRAVAAVNAADFGMFGLAIADPAAREQVRAFLAAGMLPLNGSADDLMADLEGAASLGLPGLASALSGRPVLLVGSSRDVDTPLHLHYEPLVAAYEARVAPETHVLPTDHGLSDHRVALARLLLDFLDRHLGGAVLR